MGTTHCFIVQRLPSEGLRENKILNCSDQKNFNIGQLSAVFQSTSLYTCHGKVRSGAVLKVYSFPEWNKTASVLKSVPRGGFG